MMLQCLIRFFRGPSVEEAYHRGQALVDGQIEQALSKQDEAEHLYAQASGGFNTKPHHDAFDRGVRDRLEQLGYPCPY